MLSGQENLSLSLTTTEATDRTMGPNPATASSRRRRYAPPPLWQIAAACLLLLPAFCAAIPRQLQQTTTPVFSEAPEAGDTLSSFLERAGGFDMFLASLKHLGYDRPLDGRDALPSPPRCVRAPRGPCFLWMCPPAPPCVPVAAEEKPLALAKEDGPFTVLAFNDTAFARLLGDWAKERGRDEPLALADVLRDDALESRLDDLIRYHIVKRGGDGAETYETRVTGGAPAYETAQTARESNGTTGSDLVIFRGADGRIKFHEDCVDRGEPSQPPPPHPSPAMLTMPARSPPRSLTQPPRPWTTVATCRRSGASAARTGWPDSAR